MLIPNRHDETGNYRYGFNGKENDDEVKGEGNSIDFGARMYDPRVGRWFAVDKMEEKYHSLSPYNSFANNPIFFVDPDGNDIEPWKWFRSIFGFRFGPFYSITDQYSSDVKFDRTYQSLRNSSSVFRRIIKQLQNSSRTYRFDTVYNSSRNQNSASHAGVFNPNHEGTASDPFTISFMIDYKTNKTYADSRSVIFEETFHAAQHDYALNTKTKTSSLAIEVEAKLVKNIEGLAKKGEGFDYEVMNFKGSKEIFSALRSRKKLTHEQRNLLTSAINQLSESVSREYSKGTDNYNINSFNAEFDLQFAEKLYGQDLTNKSTLPTLEIEVKK